MNVVEVENEGLMALIGEDVMIFVWVTFMPENLLELTKSASC